MISLNNNQVRNIHIFVFLRDWIELKVVNCAKTIQNCNNSSYRRKYKTLRVESQPGEI